MNNREFDLILWGATGFTGKLVAEYLLDRYSDSDLKWAVAGRNQQKLESLLEDLDAPKIPVIIADSMDEDSLNAMVQRAKVICTTVGPYAKYGSALVEACVNYQTDYCDLTGEVQWMKRMIDKHHEEARANGTRIVHTCGFDSVPSDMGVYFLQNEIHKKRGEYAQKIHLRVRAMKGGMSGGTYASLSYVTEEAEKDPSIYKTLYDPYGLNPDDGKRGKDKPDLQRVMYDKVAQSWIAPFVMAVINTKVVRRSHALAGYPYGVDFGYDEATLTGKGMSGRFKGNALLVGLGALMAAKPGSMWKKVVDKFLPDPGEGPSAKQRENGFFKIALYGVMSDQSVIVGQVTGDRDPGYGSTSKMLAEAAICLAKDKELCPDVSGVITPATALAQPYLDRLKKNAGLTFEIRH